jgi:predicted outer membrane lipoprotein
MTNLFKLAGLASVVIAALLLAVIAGDYGPWYFAWLVGTTMIVLIAASGAVLFETQEAARIANRDS